MNAAFVIDHVDLSPLVLSKGTDIETWAEEFGSDPGTTDRKSTRLNSSHTVISYAVFRWKKKNRNSIDERCPAPVARRIKIKRRSPGPRPVWSGRGTIEGPDKAADSSAYSSQTRAASNNR